MNLIWLPDAPEGDLRIFLQRSAAILVLGNQIRAKQPAHLCSRPSAQINAESLVEESAERVVRNCCRPKARKIALRSEHTWSNVVADVHRPGPSDKGHNGIAGDVHSPVGVVAVRAAGADGYVG